METENPSTTSEAEKNFIYVTLDIGDAYSCFAYTYKDAFIADGWKIDINDPWYWDKHATNKTPTTVLMGPEGEGKQTLYGYNAEVTFRELYLDGNHKHYRLFKNIKKEFYKDGVSLTSKIIDVNSGQTMPLCDIFLLFFNFLKNKATERILQRFDGVTKEDFYWVLTVPAAWTDETRHFYRDLCMETGITHRQLTVVSEPEACLAYVMQHINKKIPARSTDLRQITDRISMFDARVLVLDLSGDATTLSVHRVSGDKTFRMVFQSRSHRKGSSQVNEEFLLFLSNILGEEIIKALFNVYLEDYLTMCNEFEMRKRQIRPDTDDGGYFNFKFPYQIEETFMDMYKDEYKTITQRIKEKSEYSDRVKYDKQNFSVEIGILKEQFEKVLTRIEGYIRNVLQMPQCARVTSFLLVGGFSQSRLVQESLRERFPDVLVLVPENPELAIPKGAIIRALVPDTGPPVPEDGRFYRPNISSICSVM